MDDFDRAALPATPTGVGGGRLLPASAPEHHRPGAIEQHPFLEAQPHRLGQNQPLEVAAPAHSARLAAPGSKATRMKTGREQRPGDPGAVIPGRSRHDKARTYAGFAAAP